MWCASHGVEGLHEMGHECCGVSFEERSRWQWYRWQEHSWVSGCVNASVEGVGTGLSNCIKKSGGTGTMWGLAEFPAGVNWRGSTNSLSAPEDVDSCLLAWNQNLQIDCSRSYITDTWVIGPLSMLLPPNILITHRRSYTSGSSFSAKGKSKAGLGVSITALRRIDQPV